MSGTVPAHAVSRCGAAAARRPAAFTCRASPLDKIRDALLGGGRTAEAEPADLEDEEDLGEMASLDGMDTPAGTEDAALLVGFMHDEVEHFRAVLDDMGADMVAVIPASPSMMGGTLQSALEAGPVAYQQPALGQRRAVVLSGMYTSEVLEVISGYKDAGLPPTVFAAAVPKNFESQLSDVVESCWKDQMVAQQRAALGKLGESIEEA
ncbi:hypothetical protein MNEG_11557 [Monoraphidium neglectum]|uniref:Uncharacterized protein n=1 Tax=Monoraphidium neglectum TaxID=145388 RepID=A0A0D2J9G8_9CHLO|nr:hypothetical protein MNEG_11557 [Monoraphidium neglectum]KIY96402.1 hypothetical protein MNEG_11557 [Monoraphidium neglectum]|eukprot:XP_013895422.1 hypothetical protein MNEG_11557 [Monoraphidium neglectum]